MLDKIRNIESILPKKLVVEKRKKELKLNILQKNLRTFSQMLSQI